MSDAEEAKQAKQHDLEETPREKARRLLKDEMRLLTERYARLRGRVYRHSRFLTEQDKGELVSVLEAEREQTRTILEGISGPREFSFSSELLDQVE